MARGGRALRALLRGLEVAICLTWLVWPAHVRDGIAGVSTGGGVSGHRDFGTAERIDVVRQSCAVAALATDTEVKSSGTRL